MAAKPADTNGKIRTLTRDQARRMFDRQARRLFHMSGQEFVKRFESGKFGDPDDPYRPELMDLVMQIPLIK